MSDMILSYWMQTVFRAKLFRKELPTVGQELRLRSLEQEPLELSADPKAERFIRESMDEALRPVLVEELSLYVQEEGSILAGILVTQEDQSVTIRDTYLAGNAYGDWLICILQNMFILTENLMPKTKLVRVFCKNEQWRRLYRGLFEGAVSGEDRDPGFNDIAGAFLDSESMEELVRLNTLQAALAGAGVQAELLQSEEAAMLTIACPEKEQGLLIRVERSGDDHRSAWILTSFKPIPDENREEFYLYDSIPIDDEETPEGTVVEQILAVMELLGR